MKAGDVNAARPSTQDSWYSTPLSDPNAALWASITPPANPSLRTWLNKRLANLSLDVLAQRLQRALPGVFASNASAQRGVLGAVAALGAGVGLVGYVALGSPGADEHSAGLAAASATGMGVRAGTTLGSDDVNAPRAAAAPARVGEVLADSPTTTLASTAKPGTEQVVQTLQADQAQADQARADQASAGDPLQPGAATDEPRSVTAKSKAKAKRAAAKRKAKQRATLKRAANKPRRQAAFKFN